MPLLATLWFQQCANISVDDGPNCFWSDPVFITLFYVIEKSHIANITLTIRSVIYWLINTSIYLQLEILRIFRTKREGGVVSFISP